MRLIDADIFDMILCDAEIEAAKQKKYVLAGAINTIRGNMAEQPTVGEWVPCSERLTRSRYISVDWLEENAKEYSLGYYEEDEWATPLNVLGSAPSIDIVHCRECKYVDSKKCPIYLMGLGYTDDDFCSYGERREGKE